MNRVVIGAMNLDAVETGFSSKGGSLAKACNQICNLIRCHRPWRHCSRPQRCDGGSRPQRPLTNQFGLRDAPTVIYLEDRKTSRGTHGLSKPVQAGQMSIMCR